MQCHLCQSSGEYTLAMLAKTLFFDDKFCCMFQQQIELLLGLLYEDTHMHTHTTTHSGYRLRFQFRSKRGSQL